MSNYLTDKKVVNIGSVNLERKYGLVLPLATMDAFDQFEERLKTNKFFKSDIVCK